VGHLAQQAQEVAVVPGEELEKLASKDLEDLMDQKEIQVQLVLSEELEVLVHKVSMAELVHLAPLVLQDHKETEDLLAHRHLAHQEQKEILELLDSVDHQGQLDQQDFPDKSDHLDKKAREDSRVAQDLSDLLVFKVQTLVYLDQEVLQVPLDQEVHQEALVHQDHQDKEVIRVSEDHRVHLEVLGRKV